MQNDSSDAKSVSASRRYTRRLVAGGMLAVGLCIGSFGPDMVLKGTTIPLAWPIALLGAFLLIRPLFDKRQLFGKAEQA